MTHPPNPRQNGESLAWARLAMGYSLIALARLVGTTKGYLSEVETGRKSASLELLQRIADVLHCPLDMLLSKCSDKQMPGREKIIDEVTGV